MEVVDRTTYLCNNQFDGFIRILPNLEMTSHVKNTTYVYENTGAYDCRPLPAFADEPQPIGCHPEKDSGD